MVAELPATIVEALVEMVHVGEAGGVYTSTIVEQRTLESPEPCAVSVYSPDSPEEMLREPSASTPPIP
jgi:hypothetical protein